MYRLSRPRNSSSSTSTPGSALRKVRIADVSRTKVLIFLLPVLAALLQQVRHRWADVPCNASQLLERVLRDGIDHDAPLFHFPVEHGSLGNVKLPPDPGRDGGLPPGGDFGFQLNTSGCGCYSCTLITLLTNCYITSNIIKMQEIL